MIPNYNVYILANSRGPFYELGIPENTAFTPLVLSADEQAVHDGLFLNYTGNNFYLTAYFSAVLSMPDIQRYFRNPTSFDLSRMFPSGTAIVGGATTSLLYSFLTLPGIQEGLLNPTGSNPGAGFPVGTTAQGGRFVNNPKLRSYYTGDDTVLPLGFNYSIQYTAPDTCLLTCVEKGVSAYASCLAVGTAPNQILNITWPAGWPFVGLLQLNGQAWGASAAVTINVRPHNFPFYNILQSVQHLPYAMEVVQAVQIDSEYHQAIDSVEKMAYLIVAILLDRKQKVRQAAQITA